jgi:hypothetical protein
MPHLRHVYAALIMLAIPADVIANDVHEACQNLARAEVIFVGRVKSSPITRRVSGEEKIDKARIAMEAAERELQAFQALKMPLEIGGGRLRDLSVRAIEARSAYNEQRAMHPPPMDLSLTPILIEVPLRGVTTGDVFLQGPELDPARSYLIYAGRPLGQIAPDVISLAARPKEVEAAEAELRFLHDAIANNTGTVVHGSLTMPDPNDPQRRMPLGGIVLRMSLDDQRIEASTGADGTFALNGVPPGTLKIEPVLPEHLTLPSQSFSTQVRGGCVEVHMSATFNAHIRGRVLLDSGEPFRGFVDLVRHGHIRYLANSHALTNERGEFAFSAVPPGNYLLAINVSRQPSADAPFRSTYFPGTTDRSMAMPISVGVGTDHTNLEWVVSDRLPQGSLEVSLDSRGQPQKEMGVCVTMFDADLRNNGGLGYERISTEPVIVKVVEGVRYRLVAWARTSSGFAESEIFDVIGAPGHRAITLQMASVSERALGIRCASSHSDKPFSP